MKLSTPLLFSLLVLTGFSAFSQAPVNNQCSNATTLISNAPCINGSTFNANVQIGEYINTPCAVKPFNQTVWYKFVADSDCMYLQLVTVGYSGAGVAWSGARWAATVYADSVCIPSSSSVVSCQNGNTQGVNDQIIEEDLTGLIPGHTYMIQVGYNLGSGIGLAPNYCIKIGDNYNPACDSCSDACGSLHQFAYSPSVQEVFDSAIGYIQLPDIEGAETQTFCYTFTATCNIANFQDIILSTCQGGNVSFLDWEVSDTSCNILQSGDIDQLTITGLVDGDPYTLCYTVGVPPGCYHSGYYPYMYCSEVLSVQISSFEASMVNNAALISWKAAANDINYLELQRSIGNAENFKTIYTDRPGQTEYSYKDNDIRPGITFYRLKVADSQDDVSYSDVKYVIMEQKEIVSEKYYNIGGQEVTNPQGFYIKVILFDDNSTRVEKHF